MDCDMLCHHLICDRHCFVALWMSNSCWSCRQRGNEIFKICAFKNVDANPSNPYRNMVTDCGLWLLLVHWCLFLVHIMFSLPYKHLGEFEDTSLRISLTFQWLGRSNTFFSILIASELFSFDWCHSPLGWVPSQAFHQFRHKSFRSRCQAWYFHNDRHKCHKPKLEYQKYHLQ